MQLQTSRVTTGNSTARDLFYTRTLSITAGNAHTTLATSTCTSWAGGNLRSLDYVFNCMLSYNILEVREEEEGDEEEEEKENDKIERRLVTLLHARHCANHAIHGCFNPVQPTESADHKLYI